MFYIYIYNSIGKVVDALQQLLPDTLIYSLNISDSDNELIEIKNSFLGNVNEQVNFIIYIYIL